MWGKKEKKRGKKSPQHPCLQDKPAMSTYFHSAHVLRSVTFWVDLEKIGHSRIPKHIPLAIEKATGVSLVNPDDTSASYLMRNFLLAPMMCVNNVQPFSVALSPLLSRGHLN